MSQALFQELGFRCGHIREDPPSHGVFILMEETDTPVSK